MTSHPIADMLAAQDPQGWWVNPGPGYGPKYRSTVWTLMFLDQLGADGADPRIRRACEYVLENTQASSGGFGIRGGRTVHRPAPSTVVHCLNGNLLARAPRLRLAGRRARAARHRLAGRGRDRGGRRVATTPRPRPGRASAAPSTRTCPAAGARPRCCWPWRASRRNAATHPSSGRWTRRSSSWSHATPGWSTIRWAGATREPTPSGSSSASRPATSPMCCRWRRDSAKRDERDGPWVERAVGLILEAPGCAGPLGQPLRLPAQAHLRHRPTGSAQQVGHPARLHRAEGCAGRLIAR